MKGRLEGRGGLGFRIERVSDLEGLEGLAERACFGELIIGFAGSDVRFHMGFCRVCMGPGSFRAYGAYVGFPDNGISSSESMQPGQAPKTQTLNPNPPPPPQKKKKKLNPKPHKPQTPKSQNPKPKP